MYPALFKIGGFKVHSFGVMLIIAFFSGLWLALKRAGRYGFQRSEVFDFAFWTLLWGVLGARIVFILQEWSVYRDKPSDLLTLQFQGLTSFGGILFGLGYLAYYCTRRKKSLLDILDLLCLPMLLGHAIGRIGCLLNGCCFGGV